MDQVPTASRPTPLLRLLPWGLAVVALAAAAWFGVQASMARAQNQALRDQLALAEVSLQSAANQLEAERMISARLAEQLAAAKGTDTTKR